MGDRNAFGHRRSADIGETGILPDHPAGADEQRLATRLLHNAGVRCSRPVEDRQNLPRRWIRSRRCFDFDSGFLLMSADPRNVTRQGGD